MDKELRLLCDALVAMNRRIEVTVSTDDRVSHKLMLPRESVRSLIDAIENDQWDTTIAVQVVPQRTMVVSFSFGETQG